MPDYNPYETRRLVGVVRDLVRPSTFLLDMFFRNLIGPTGSEKVQWDVEGRNKGVAAFVAPLAAGKPVRERGYYTREIEPASVKTWMNFDPFGPLSRMVGEAPAAPVKAGERQRARLVKGFADLQTITFRKLEMMACEVITTGKQLISGEGYANTLEIDFQRAVAFTKALTSPNRWGDANISPVKVIEALVQEYIAENGVPPDRIVFDPLAWSLFRDDALFDKHVDINYRRKSGPGEMDYLTLGNVQQGQCMGALRSGANVELWVYQQTYLDTEGQSQKAIPDYSVILGSSLPEMQQTQCFGTIVDPAFGYESETLRDPETGAILEFAPWHEFARKPAIGESIGLSCRPLMVLSRPNAVMYVKVR